MRRLAFGLPILAFSTLPFGACSSAATAGDRDLDNVEAITAVEELRLGHVQDPELGFSAIGPVAVDDDGNVYVVEMQAAMWVIERDEFDVPWLVRYRLEIQ